MVWQRLRNRITQLDLQARVVLILLLVIGPTYLVVSLAVGQITIPVIEDELRVVGVHAASDLAEEVHTGHLLQVGKEEDLEAKLRQAFFLQPNVVEVDAFRKTDLGAYQLAGSTEDVSTVAMPAAFPDQITSLRKEEGGPAGIWEIWVPIRTNTSKHILGMLRMEVSLQSAFSLYRAVWKVNAIAGGVNIVLLILALSYFLRKTIQNDRKLRIAESHNVELSEQLREAERELMIKEKLAAMGQLTASFAHEIGTPLNAVGGHLHLLREDLKRAPDSRSWQDRLDVISDQLVKIENIVKGFLHNTAKAPSQHQLLDVNKIIDKTIGIVRPRIDAQHVGLEKNLDKEIALIRAVPLDVEQVLLNLLNNSLDSLNAKRKRHPEAKGSLEVFSRYRKEGLKEWIELGVLDTGEGIPKKDLTKVFVPFFTTKAAGEGTGLGLPICRDIARKYRGDLDIESKEGSWTRVTLRLPLGAQL